MRASGWYWLIAAVVLLTGCHRKPYRDSAAAQLRRAAWMGDLGQVQTLIAKGAPVNAKDSSGSTALHEAAGVVTGTSFGSSRPRPKGQVQVPDRTLLRNSLSWRELEMGWSKPFYLMFVLALLAGGCKKTPTRVRSSGMEETPLHRATMRGDIEKVRSLIAEGADVNAKAYSFWSRDEVTPLHAAVRRGDGDIAVLLIDKGARVNAATSDGWTPLHAAAEGCHYDVAKLLIEKGADVNATDERGDAPLYTAILAGDGQVVELLVAAGADVNRKNQQGLSLLHRAILSLSPSIRSDTIAPLLVGGADVNAVTPSGCTPLHFAAREGHVRAAELLLAHGANVNAKTTSGQTPLHFAVRRGHDDVVGLLMEKGADVTVKDRDGRNPLDHARAAGQGRIVALLIRDKMPESPGAEYEEAEANSLDRPSVDRREPQTDVEKLVSGNCAFAVDLYRGLGTKEGNLFFSPYSISAALAMTYAGSRENTENEMAKTLHFSLDQPGLHPAFAEIQGMLNKVQASGNIKLCIANSLWPQVGHPFLEEYLSLIEKHYGASITAVDYRTEGTQDAARQTINQWVEEKTENRIKELIQPQQLSDSTRLVLTNAIYFKGKWENEFDPKDTKDAAFFVSPSKSIQVPTMHHEEVFGYAQVKYLQVLEMPYRGNELSMLVLLPARIEGLKELEQSLSVEVLRGWKSHLQQKKVIVFLPKFRVTFRAELKAALQSMGMVDAFRWPGANFAGFDGDPNWFYIGAVIHQAYVDVNEEGTEAAAATAVVGMMGGMPAPPPVFRADHPFLFLIQENSTGSILLMGRVANPIQTGQ